MTKREKKTAKIIRIQVTKLHVPVVYMNGRCHLAGRYENSANARAATTTQTYFPLPFLCHLFLLFTTTTNCSLSHKP